MDNILHDHKWDGGMDAEQQDNPYDCRWQDGIDEPTITPGEKEEDTYDCRWDDPKSIKPQQWSLQRKTACMTTSHNHMVAWYPTG